MSNKKSTRDYQGIIQIMISKYGWKDVGECNYRIKDFEDDDENFQNLFLPDDEYAEKLFEFWKREVELMNKRHMSLPWYQGLRYQEDIEKEEIPIYQITSKSLDWKKLSIYKKNGIVEYGLDDCEEYTYLFIDRVHSILKIGRTKNVPELRFTQLKTANPNIEILHVFPSTQYSESELHKRFNDFRKELEWFFYSKSLNVFLTNELEKHNSIITSFFIQQELTNNETTMLDLLLI
jgi:hypothetical protein